MGPDRDSGFDATIEQELLDRVARLSRDSSRVYVGFSGGLDSTVLLHLAARVARERVLRGLVAVHIHHGLQAPADAWLQHADAVARGLGVEFLARRVSVASGGSLELAARSARYAVFRELLAEPGACLLLAHHRDDQVETLLMRALQGRGIYGMPAQRPLAAGVLLRPLLQVPRSTLLQYARQHNLTWVEDPSNAALDADRNYLRNDILPRLRTRFPQTDQALLTLALTSEMARSQARSGQPVADSLELAALDAAAEISRVTRLREWLLDLGVAAPPTRALKVFVEQLMAGADRQPALVLTGGELRRYQDRIWFVPTSPVLASVYPVPADGRLELPHGVLLVQPDPTGAMAFPPFEVRFRKGGEHIDFNGHRRDLKTLLHTSGMPPWTRAYLPLVHDAGGLFCVPGIAVRNALPEVRTGMQGDCYSVHWYPRNASPHIH
jgi:tRNA(Ile)-lysidine synthase